MFKSCISVLDARTDRRVDQMIEAGLIAELTDFHEQYNKMRVQENRLVSIISIGKFFGEKVPYAWPLMNFQYSLSDFQQSNTINNLNATMFVGFIY